MKRLVAVATLVAALAGCGAGGVKYEVDTVENERLADGSHRIVVEIEKTGTWDWQSVEVRDFVVSWTGPEGGALTTGVELLSNTGEPIPDRFQIVFKTRPVSEKAKDPVLRFQLVVKAKKHAGASNAGGSFSHEIPIFD